MSRASDLGVSPAKLNRATSTRIQKAERLMEEIAGLWGDVDEGMVMSADMLRDQLSDMRRSLAHSLDCLKQGWGDE